MSSGDVNCEETFAGPDLDRERWTPHHLPHWSTPALSRARYHFDQEGLVLRIDEDQPEWCPDQDPGVRVSALQSGHSSGPIGSSAGQHRFIRSLRVRTDLPALALLTPRYARISLTARADISASQLVSLYLIGYEQESADSGEITLMEIFGDGISEQEVVLNVGVKRINDDRLRDEIHAVRRAMKVGDWHDYGMEWTPSGITFRLDGETIATTSQSPGYRMQLMLTIYDLSGKEPGSVLQSGAFHIKRISIGP